MISTLIFLSVSLVFSQQQRYPAQKTGDMMYWLSHYYLPSRQAFNNFNYHPDNSEDHPGYYHPFLRHFTALAKPNSQIFSQQVKMVCL
jgi:predicted Abi (CAAX) family protease